MGSFDFVLILLSFVYALALGHLLQRVGGLLVARERVRFSGLLTLAIVNAVAQVYIDWLAIWEFRAVGAWDLYTITLFFVSSIVLFLMCAAVAPEAPADQSIDMEAFYEKNHRLFYGLYVLLLATFLAMTLVTPDRDLALQQALGNVPYFLISFLAIFVSARWAQWLAGIALLVLSAAWPIVFSSALH